MGGDIIIDFRMFALANSKELLNSVALIIYQRCLKFRTRVMTFSTDAKNAQEWYGFEYAKDHISRYDCQQYRDPRRELYPVVFEPWKNTLDECGKLLGNNGIVFCLFNIQNPDEEENCPIAYYSSPDGVGKQTSGTVKAAWGRHFEKGIKSPVYMIGSQLVPYELSHTKTTMQVRYPRGADSSYDLMLEKRREKLASARSKKAPKEKQETEKKKGYYEVAVEEPEKIPFGINDLQEYIRKGISEAGMKPIRIPEAYSELEKCMDTDEKVEIRGKHFTLAAAGELYEDLKKMIEAGGGILHEQVVQKDDYLVICFGVESFDETETKKEIDYKIYNAMANKRKKCKVKIVMDYQLLAALVQEPEK